MTDKSVNKDLLLCEVLQISTTGENTGTGIEKLVNVCAIMRESVSIHVVMATKQLLESWLAL
jgi:hypothetical protein